MSFLSLFKKSSKKDDYPTLDSILENYRNEYHEEFYYHDVQQMISYGVAVEATNGGLILGRSHEDGGIYMLLRTGEMHYSLVGEIEGYEYILNAGATKVFRDEFANYINDRERDLGAYKEDYAPPINTGIIDASSDSIRYMIFETGQFAITNKHSTVYFLDSLDLMNKAVTIEKVAELRYEINHNYRGPINLYLRGQLIRTIPQRI